MKRAAMMAAMLVSACDPPELTVFAATSMGPAMEEAAREFPGEAAPRVVTAGSQILARQIEAGAPADVFAPASEDHARAISDRLEAIEPLVCNRLVIVTSDARVRSVRDLSVVERLVVGTPEVPIGAYTERVLERAGERWGAELRAGIEARIVSRELDVAQVLAKVTMGEADAAIVYASDVGRTSLRVVAIDDGLADEPRYPIAVLRTARASAQARQFVEWMRSPSGIEILERNGFVRCER